MGRLTLARTSAAVVGTSVTVMLAAAIPAAAQTEARLDNRWTDGLTVNLVGHEPTKTTLIGLGVNGKHLDTYCVELRTSVDPRYPDMVEVPWDEYPSKESPFHVNRNKVNWVLHHSYPTVDLKTLGETAGVEGNVSEQEAIAATQAAIWHFSDDAELNKADATPGDQQSDADVLAVYDYLTGAENTGIEEPEAVLEVTPEKKSGTAGERIGPFTVSSTADKIEVLAEFPKGVKLTDKDGNELPTADAEMKIKQLNKYDVYVDVPESTQAGKGSFTANIEAPLNLGRLFIGKEYRDHPTQSLILAKSETLTLSAKAEVDWTAATPPTTTTVPPTTTAPTITTTSPAPVAAAPQPTNTSGLAQTGASIFAPIVIGVVLVGAGIGALLIQRRRKRV
jgi:TQXA domain-containing protein/LPXTG-motif cell wall-anchored protein